MNFMDTFGHRPGLKLQLLYNPHVELSKGLQSPFSLKYGCLRKWTCILKDWEDQVFILFLVLQVPSNGDWWSPLDGTDVEITCNLLVSAPPSLVSPDAYTKQYSFGCPSSS